MVSLDAFNATIEASKKRVTERFVEFHKAIVATSYNFISADSEYVGFSYGSPVWSGSFIQSHNVAIGAPDPSVRINPEASKTNWPTIPDVVYSAKPASYVVGRLQGLQPFETVFISNNLFYAENIEHGASRRAPEGVYMLAAELVKAKFKDAKYSYNVSIKHGSE